MSKHLQRDLERLRKNILMLGTLVEEATDKSIKAISRSDQKILDELFKGEERINQMEVDIEEECLKLLALHQPVATDLRFIVAVLKVNNDLERMGDQAINIADRVSQGNFFPLHAESVRKVAPSPEPGRNQEPQHVGPSAATERAVR